MYFFTVRRSSSVILDSVGQNRSGIFQLVKYNVFMTKELHKKLGKIFELTDLRGRDKLKGENIYSIVEFDH